MKRLKEYIFESLDNIFEANLSSKDFYKHNYKYIKGLLLKLLSKEDVRLGKNGNSGTVNISDLTAEEQKYAEECLNKLQNNIAISEEDFNKIFVSKKLTRSSFFKGDYSGYKDGLDSGNKGNAFEQYFIDNYKEKFEKNIKKIHPYKTLLNIERNGGKNSKRPLTFSSNSITCGQISNNDFNIGETITDVTLKVINNNEEKEPIYLSLKSGNTVTFANEGIKRLFPNNYFDENSEYKLNKNAKALLNLFLIDESKFKKSFISYVKNNTRIAKGKYEIVDITDKLKHNDMFIAFLKSVIGYGFIMVHQNIGDDIDYIDFSTDDQLKKYVTNIKSAEIKYPQNGETKRLIVNVKLELIEFNFIFRAKDGGIYPTHLLADYKFI